MKRTFSRYLAIRDAKEGGLFGFALSCLYAFSYLFSLPYFFSFITKQILPFGVPSDTSDPHGSPLFAITGSQNDGLTNPVSPTGSRRLTPYIYMHECNFRTKVESTSEKFRSPTSRVDRLTSDFSLLSSKRITF